MLSLETHIKICILTSQSGAVFPIYCLERLQKINDLGFVGMMASIASPAYHCVKMVICSMECMGMAVGTVLYLWTLN